ncbi:asparagine synthetase [Pyrenophora seminiperda CCB06]|uniref:Asparagine synthetase n=1 Tax=Pyrenophora seminiperda CCB06 TaxID=1302712 RepID=A0A3M7M417_9PLEO|nr:asparagine synthetase [Pyrenophora seminiperda CCB06]
MDRVIAARDPIGITTFYMGRSSTTPGAVYFASELKCLHPVCDNIISFPPGHVYDSKTDSLTRYYDPKWLVEPESIPTTPVDYKEVRQSLERSVRKRMMAEVPFGVLLSGGLDSSLVASIAQRETLRLNEATRKKAAASSGAANEQQNQLVGIDDSNELQTDLLLGQLNSFSIECIRRVKNLHLADCLRANKSTSAWGVEARVPFLDKEFLNTAMNIDPADKLIDRENGRMEKYILRKAFDTSDEPDTQPYLPDKILWRQKEQFSDGVGYGWIDALKDTAELHVTDEMMKKPKPEWGSDIPDTKEAYWYRCMFDEHFPSYCADTVMRWTPTWSNQTDPSGRAIGVHEQKYAHAK